MKHENNFFLYIMGSAFLIMFGMVLVSEVSLERRQTMIANAISSSFSFEKKEKITKAYFVGKVFEDVNSNNLFDKEFDKPITGRQVSLWKQGELSESHDSSLVSKTFTNIDGDYLFSVEESGMFFIKISSEDGEEIISPKPIIEGFSYSEHARVVNIDSGEYYYAGMDFAIKK